MKKLHKVFLIIISTAAVMFYAMSFLSVGFETRNIWNNFNPVRLIEKISEARKFSEIKQIIADNYVDEVDIDKLLESAYDSMIGSLNDKYSVYFTKEELENYLNRRQGAFYGIGVNIRTDYDNLTVEVTGFPEGSPARLAGIAVGDLIISADGVSFTDKDSLIAMIDLIRGEEGTKVSIGVYREETGEDLTFEVTRAKIYLNNTNRALIGDIGYIRIDSFTTGVSEDFIEACEWLKGQDINGLIVDVRGNGGGSLDEVIRISDYLLGDDMIVYVEDRYGDRKEYYSDSELYEIPLAVLVDSSSASASELFTGAIQDNGRGMIFGETTFGKGIVQTDYYLGDGSGLKITTKKYYLPSGICIQGIGITPDTVIEQDSDYTGFDQDNIPDENDLVLKGALEYLSQDQ
jgi:carboxyl-terminal processing protease